MLEHVGADVLAGTAGASEWRTDTLPDRESVVAYPAKWRTALQPDGSELAFDLEGNAIAWRSVAGWYFEPNQPILADAETIADVEPSARRSKTSTGRSSPTKPGHMLEAKAKRLPTGRHTR